MADAIPTKHFVRTALTGGAAGSLAAISGALLEEGYTCEVTVSGIEYNYWLNATSGAAESSPAVISPATSAGNKRWILKGLRVASLSVTGNIVFPVAGAGIDFSATTDAAGKTSELFNDYEEGAWAPAITFGGNAVGITYTTQVGLYVKVGKHVTLTANIVMSNKGSSVGAALITGLPFATATHSGGGAAGAFRIDNVVANANFQGNIPLSLSTITLTEVTAAGVITEITSGDFANNSAIRMSISYVTA